MDHFQMIADYDPKKTMRRPTLQLLQNYWSLRRGRGKHLIDQLKQKNIPLITTFFTVAYMAEEHGFENDIYLVICDTDISRTWAPRYPSRSRIKYLAPSEHVSKRLQTYGVKAVNIFVTGFPLPGENIGGYNQIILKKDLATRIHNLDPKHVYRSTYGAVVQKILKQYDHEQITHPLTVTFAVGGAGAQKEQVRDIIASLHQHLIDEKMRLVLVAGVRPEVDWYFRKCLAAAGLNTKIGKSVQIIFKPTKAEYFKQFDSVLRTTDVLWTKPSELVFYSSLGIPIIIAPALGSQEEFNQTWLEKNGAGMVQSDPRRTHQWLFDWLVSGAFAGAAMNAFANGEQRGVENITKVVFG